MDGSGFRVYKLVLSVNGSDLDCWNLVFRVQGVGLSIQCLEFKVQVQGFRVLVQFERVAGLWLSRGWEFGGRVLRMQGVGFRVDPSTIMGNM
jgi:hypothetical protein